MPPKFPLCFPAQVYTGRWAMRSSNPSTLWLEMQLPRFRSCLVLFSEVKHWAEHQTCQHSWCGTSLSKHCWHSWNLPDGRREASEKPQIQTSCFPFVTLGIQKQVNKTLRWKSTQLYLLIWPWVITFTKLVLVCTLQQVYFKQWKICGFSKSTR